MLDALDVYDLVPLPTAVGVLRHSQCTPAAELFASFLISEAAQGAFAAQGQLPFMPGAPRPEALGGVEPEAYSVPLAEEYIELQNFVMDMAGTAFGTG